MTVVCDATDINDATDVYDAIVVGSGAAGSWAAKELTEGGCRVLLLEAGGELDAEKDFSSPQQPANIGFRLRAAATGQSIQARSPSFAAHTRHLYVDDRRNPYSVPSGKPFLWIRGRQLGGRMHVWARTALRMSDSELRGEDRPGRPPEMHWPLSYRDLEPYYDKVERTLGVHGNRDGISNLPDGNYGAPIAIAPSNQRFARLLRERTGLTLVQNRVVRHSPRRLPLPLILARKTGRLDVRTDAVVSHLLIHRKSGQARGVGYYDRRSKAYREAFGKVVMLCASAFESVRILLNSACPRHPDGVGGSSGLLGRYLCDHLSWGCDGFCSSEYFETDSLRGPYRGEPYDFAAYDSMILPDFCGRWGERPDFVGGYGVQCGVMPPIWWARAFGEMVPRFENRLTLSKRRRDAWGIPVAHIRVQHSDNEVRMLAHMKSSIRELAEIAGLTPAEPPLAFAGTRLERSLYRILKPVALQSNGAFHPGAAIHETGGARMGDDPQSSVLNPYCQCWDAPNVFVTDGSCFVTSGYQNHTLTIMALTVRACEHILKEFSHQIGSHE